MTTIKRFLTLFFATILAVNVWGADATFTFSAQGYSNAETVTSGTIDTYSSWTATKGGSNDPKYYNAGTGLRVYNGGSFSISSSKTIASITLTFSSSDYTFSSSNTTTPQTVTPDATSYEWSVSRTCRLQKIEITYTSGGTSTVATPTFSPAEGSYSSTQSVTISCATTGATVYYTTDGSTPTTSSTEYSSAISVSSTTTIKAIATKSDMDNSGVASATYTITGGGGGSCGGIFSETWDGCDGTGGNSGGWNGTVASSPAVVSDNSGWTYSTGYKGDKCIRTNKGGTAQTPSISVISGTTYILNYKAADWGSDGCTFTLSATGATITAGSSSGTLSQGSWGNHSATLTATASTMQITFAAKSGARGWLDDICISDATPCSSSITITKGSDPEHGSFTLSSSGSVCIDGGNASTTVTATPDTHWHLATVTSTDGGSVGTISGNTCTVSNISANTTINVTFAENTKHTVKFYNNGAELTSERKEVYDGDAIGTLPTLSSEDACDLTSKTFMGWTESTISAKTSSAPTFIDASTTISANKSYNAVWAKASPGGASGTVTANTTTLKNAVSSISSGYASKTFNLTDGVNNYSCTVIATKSTQSATSGWMQVGKVSDSRYLAISTALPGAITNISASSIYNASAGDWTGTVYYNTSASKDGAIASQAFSSVSSFSLDVTGGSTTGYILFSNPICLGDLSITYTSVSYSDYITLCGATIAVEAEYYITSTKDQSVKISIPVSAYSFENASTLTASISGDGFSLVGWTNKAITAGATLNTEVVVQYRPGAFGSTGNATLTLSDTQAEADSKTVTIHGRSLPAEFAIVANSSGDFAMPANMAATTESRKAQSVTFSDGKVKCVPAAFLYTLEGVKTSRYGDHGTAVRLKGSSTGKYLKAVGSDSNEFMNTDYTDSELFEWLLITEDNESYTIQSHDAATATDTRLVRYRSTGHFGNYTATTGGQSIVKFYEVKKACMPLNVKVTNITHNSAKIKFDGTADSHTLTLTGAGYSGTYAAGAAYASATEITGLAANTEYTYTITPECGSDCAVQGTFTTTTAPIHVILSRNGVTEDLGEVKNPYTLPTSVVAPCEEWTFMGWYNNTYVNQPSAPTFVTQATANGTYYAVYRKGGGSGGSTTTDAITASDLEATDNSYTDFDNVAKTSPARYAGSSAYGNDVIQLNSKSDKGVGIVSTTSGGILKTVAVIWNSNTKAGRSIIVYGSNSPYTDGYELYNSSTYGTSLGTISKGSTTSLDAASVGNYSYVGIRASDAVYINSLSITWSSESVTYSTSTDCKACTTAGASFKMGNHVSKNTKSTDFTNEVQYTKENTKQQKWTSSNTAIATVNASNGLVHILGVEGETDITVKQVLDDTNDPDNVCAVNITYTLTVSVPAMDVVEVTKDDKIIIEHDIDGDSKLVIDTLDVGITGEPAKDIFFSKYFEASSNMKLFALYNGTEEYIDLRKIRVRASGGDIQKNTNIGWSTKKGDLNYVELKDVSKLGVDFPDFQMPPFTEIIFWSNNQGSGAAATYNATLRGCIDMTIDNKFYDYDDMADGKVPHWYCLGNYINYNQKDADGNNQFVFNGDDALILERDSTAWGKAGWYPIDLFGAGTAEEPEWPTYVETNKKPTTTTEGGPVVNGKIKMVTAGGTPKETYDKEKYTIKGNAETPLNDDPGGYWALPEGASIPLSTNRYYLTRKNTVKDGSDAVRLNTAVFATLATEWNGAPVGGNRDADCYSGEMFSDVGEYNYASYYSNWGSVISDFKGFNKEPDGTYSLALEDLSDYACKNMRIYVTNTAGTDTLAKVNYKVPIIVKEGTKTTLDALFTGPKLGKKVCKTCDVAILAGATLEANDDANAVKEVRNIEIYPGGMLNISGTKELAIEQLIMRSREDVVPRAKLASPNFTRRNTNILFDKRMTGKRWYWISLPYDWNTADVTHRNGESAVYGTDWWLREYNGAVRATGDESTSTNWTTVPAGEIKAGKGYIVAVDTLQGHKFSELRFPLDASTLDKDRSAVTVPVNAWGAKTSVAPNHLGWNMIGNPYLNDYAATGLPTCLTVGELVFNSTTSLYELDTSGGLRYVVIPTKAGGYGFDNYIQVALGTQDALDPFMAYFVQIDGATAGAPLNVEFTNGSNLRKSPVRRAPQEYMDAPADEIVWVPISITNIMDEKDETTFLVNDRFTDNYDMMDDLAKWRNQYYQYEIVSTKPVIASRNNDGEMAFNALPDASAEAGIPLNYFAANRGMYTITLEDKYGVNNIQTAILYDAIAKKEHDLKAAGPYEFSSERDDNTTRFTLYLTVDRHKVPTDIGNIDATDAPRKLLINGQVLILRGKRVYDITGKLLLNQ